MRRFWSKVKKAGPDECWEWQAGRTNGYGIFWMNGKSRRASRVSYEMEIGPIPKGLSVCHTCDNPPCVNPAHLFLGTTADNLADRDLKGRGADRRGSSHHLNKLTEDDVENIRANRMNLSGRELARLFGVSPASISNIIKRKSWRHV